MSVSTCCVQRSLSGASSGRGQQAGFTLQGRAHAHACKTGCMRGAAGGQSDACTRRRACCCACCAHRPSAAMMATQGTLTSNHSAAGQATERVSSVQARQMPQLASMAARAARRSARACQEVGRGPGGGSLRGSRHSHRASSSSGSATASSSWSSASKAWHVFSACSSGAAGGEGGRATQSWQGGVGIGIPGWAHRHCTSSLCVELRCACFGRHPAAESLTLRRPPPPLPAAPTHRAPSGWAPLPTAAGRGGPGCLQSAPAVPAHASQWTRGVCHEV